MSDQITYDDKADLIVDTTIDDIFKVSASDMNEIKKVVNSHADDIDVANNNITDLNNNKLDINAVLNQASTDTDKTYSADYLNDKLVSVGTTAPTDGRRVWFKKGKNLFDGQLELGMYDETGAKATNNANYRNVAPINVQPSTTYTFSINGTSQKYVIYLYKEDGTFIRVDTLTSGTFTTPAEAYLLNFRCFNADFTSDYANLKIQLEKGSTATAYEPYVEQGIYVDEEEWYNPNNIEKYSTNEIKIGTWIDGKPLYRKVVDIGALPNASTKQVAHNISNMGSVVTLRGMVTDGGFFPIPYCATTNAYAISLFATTTTITVITGSDRSSVTGFAIIEYTKTTD